ncbi:hypothetical protein [Fimbriiglobus ruber]|uniref:Uncharacterized protein n=1 Tax=Fimbriiglobus ruber TaxID=1908690 RepID=A0A225DHU8_9BACT|nr:hypothetical protein [Fimbriiglobus ruber]OWK38118.1 hypothetical protein FRUB_07238 [Fimbriiglobus ruber]
MRDTEQSDVNAGRGPPAAGHGPARLTSSYDPPADSFVVHLTPRAAPIVGPPVRDTEVPHHKLLIRIDPGGAEFVTVSLLQSTAGDDLLIATRACIPVGEGEPDGGEPDGEGEPCFLKYKMVLTRHEAARIDDYGALRVVVAPTVCGTTTSTTTTVGPCAGSCVWTFSGGAWALTSSTCGPATTSTTTTGGSSSTTTTSGGSTTSSTTTATTGPTCNCIPPAYCPPDVFGCSTFTLTTGCAGGIVTPPPDCGGSTSTTSSTTTGTGGSTTSSTTTGGCIQTCTSSTTTTPGCGLGCKLAYVPGVGVATVYNTCDPSANCYCPLEITPDMQNDECLSLTSPCVSPQPPPPPQPTCGGHVIGSATGRIGST